MNNTTVYIKVKSVYGNELIYPVNDVAHQFTMLTGRKTLSRRDLNRIQLLGFKIEEVTHLNSLDFSQAVA